MRRFVATVAMAVGVPITPAFAADEGDREQKRATGTGRLDRGVFVAILAVQLVWIASLG
jgi:hypothetical protein